MTNKEVVKAFFIESYQNHNYDFAMKYVAQDYFDHSPANARSNSDAVGIMKIVESQFANMEIEILDLIEEGDKVAARIKYKGKQIGTVMGVKPTGKWIEFEALEIFALKDGIVTETWGYWPDVMIKELLEK